MEGTIHQKALTSVEWIEISLFDYSHGSEWTMAAIAANRATSNLGVSGRQGSGCRYPFIIKCE